MGDDVDVPTLFAQKGEIGDRRFRSGNQNQVDISGDRRAGVNNYQRHPRLDLQRIEIVKIGQSAERRHRDDNIAFATLRIAGQSETIFGWQSPHILEPRNHAETRPAGFILDYSEALGEQPRVAAKLVDQESFEPRSVAFIQHFICPDQTCDHPTAIDIANKNHGEIGG